MKQEIYSIKEFCKHYSIGRTTLYREINAGKIRMFKCGYTTLINHDEAERWWKQRYRIRKYKPRRHILRQCVTDNTIIIAVVNWFSHPFKSKK